MTFSYRGMNITIGIILIVFAITLTSLTLFYAIDFILPAVLYSIVLVIDGIYLIL